MLDNFIFDFYELYIICFKFVDLNIGQCPKMLSMVRRKCRFQLPKFKFKKGMNQSSDLTNDSRKFRWRSSDARDNTSLRRSSRKAKPRFADISELLREVNGSSDEELKKKGRKTRSQKLVTPIKIVQNTVQKAKRTTTAAKHYRETSSEESEETEHSSDDSECSPSKQQKFMSKPNANYLTNSMVEEKMANVRKNLNASFGNITLNEANEADETDEDIQNYSIVANSNQPTKILLKLRKSTRARLVAGLRENCDKHNGISHFRLNNSPRPVSTKTPLQPLQLKSNVRTLEYPLISTPTTQKSILKTVGSAAAKNTPRRSIIISDSVTTSDARRSSRLSSLHASAQIFWDLNEPSPEYDGRSPRTTRVALKAQSTPVTPKREVQKETFKTPVKGNL